MSPVSILPARLDWPSAIGSLLLNFGTLEYFVSIYLNDHLNEHEYSKVKEWHLKDRLTRIARQMEKENRPAADRSAFAQLIKRIEPMRELRNHIAHGQMHFGFDAATKKPMVTLLKVQDVDNASLPETNRLEFAELENALTTMSQLIQEFERLAGFKTTWTDTTTEDLKK
jgi:hypothetical protein